MGYCPPTLIELTFSLMKGLWAFAPDNSVRFRLERHIEVRKMGAHVMKKLLAPMLIVLLTVAQAQAATVLGGTTLLDSTSANQLESWLGQGSITLTNIFTKGANDNSTTFHNAVDGKGPTFVLMSATQVNSGAQAIIGGYDPQSWSSINNYNLTFADSERTGFIFNLSTNTQLRQNLTTELISNVNGDLGLYQTYNNATYGPTFGGGHDIYVDGSLNFGYSQLFSYSDQDNVLRSIVDGSTWQGVQGISYGAIEVFTISNTAPIPEPETYAMMLAGLGLLGFSARRRKQKTA
jgi:hypothetical protein